MQPVSWNSFCPVSEFPFGMIPLGAAAAGLLMWNAGQAAKREERTVATELIGIAGLTLTATAAYYVGTMRWDAIALYLWAANALYFASSVFYVRYRVRELRWVATATSLEGERRQASVIVTVSNDVHVQIETPEEGDLGNVAVPTGLLFLNELGHEGADRALPERMLLELFGIHALKQVLRERRS